MSILRNTDFSRCPNANLRAITRAVDAVYRRHLRPFSVTESQLNILAVVAQQQEVTQSEVGKILIMERSTVSRDLRRLVDKQLVSKVASGTSYQLRLTPAGTRFMESVVPAWESAVAETEALLGIEADRIRSLRSRL